MAEQSSFFNALIQNGIPDRTYKAEIFAQYFGSFIGNGVFPNPSTGLQVLAVDNNMTVRVKEGKGWINGYFYENTDDLILSIDNADGVLNRIDRVVLRLDFLDREIRMHVKKGTFSSNPVTPSLLRDANVYELGICDIKVSAGSLQIRQSNITDLRLNSELCGLVKGTIEEIDTTTLYNQLQARIQEKGLDMDTWIEEAKEFFTNDFNNWFDSIKGALDGDVAGNLLNKINALEEVINTMELTSTKVLRPSGKTVEESISANETSILNNSKEIEDLKLNASNGKNIVATSVGSPLLATDTFATIGSKIDELTNTFKSNLIEKGITVNPDDKMSILIDNVALLGYYYPDIFYIYKEGKENIGFEFAGKNGINLGNGIKQPNSILLQSNQDQYIELISTDKIDITMYSKINFDISVDILNYTNNYCCNALCSNKPSNEIHIASNVIGNTTINNVRKTYTIDISKLKTKAHILINSRCTTIRSTNITVYNIWLEK